MRISVRLRRWLLRWYHHFNPITQRALATYWQELFTDKVERTVNDAIRLTDYDVAVSTFLAKAEGASTSGGMAILLVPTEDLARLSATQEKPDEAQPRPSNVVPISIDQPFDQDSTGRP